MSQAQQDSRLKTQASRLKFKLLASVMIGTSGNFQVRTGLRIIHTAGAVGFEHFLIGQSRVSV